MIDFSDIKVIWTDGEDRIVTRNDKVLSKSEIVDLLVEYMEENIALHHETIDYKVQIEQKQVRIDFLERKIQREINATTKQYEKWEKEAETKIKELSEENEQLKQTLKDSYINEICENCKYGHYYLSDNFDGGFEGDFECLKKHFDNEHWKCDGLKECDDFELDFKGDVE